MALNDVIRQPFYEEDEMSKKIIDICMAAYEDDYSGGYVGQQLHSKMDRKLSYLYYNINYAATNCSV